MSLSIKTCPMICCANQWTGFYMIGTIVMKELIRVDHQSNQNQSDICIYYKDFLPVKVNPFTLRLKSKHSFKLLTYIKLSEGMFKL